MRSFNISFKHIEAEFDETQFDVTGGDPAELLELFDAFCFENGITVEAGSIKTSEVSYDG